MSNQERLPTVKKDTSPIPVVNRVLIMGSRLGGAFQFGEGFQKYLEERGVPEPSVEVLRNANLIEKAVLDSEDTDEGRGNPNLPRGVILLPEMRQYTPSGQGMTIDTNLSGIGKYVEGLCAKHNIPLVKINKYESPEQLSEGLRQIMEESEFENRPT